MAVTLRRSTVLSHAAVDRTGRSLGNDTMSSTWRTNTKAREIAAVTSVWSNATEQPCSSLPTGQTSGIVPQFRLHWSRLVSTATEGGALRKEESSLDRPHLLPRGASRRRRKDSAEKSGRTEAKCCCNASVSCWLRSTSPRSNGDPAAGLAGRASSQADRPITTTGFISMRCRKESPKARLWTISLVANTELSTWGRRETQMDGDTPDKGRLLGLFRLVGMCRSAAGRQPSCSCWANAADFPSVPAASALIVRRCGPNVSRCRWPPAHRASDGHDRSSGFLSSNYTEVLPDASCHCRTKKTKYLHKMGPMAGY
ncbi:hypothetical protein EYF80_047762 [Liparis tanakae]|uniref:Uncharacterized protein n=1 Tax=Liparis tanakae TaxID=230148 RepID=A0A4Z2FM21_9TELE|nr:hypothetical protein EYF80_047762 [Liparis tanakae]